MTTEPAMDVTQNSADSSPFAAVLPPPKTTWLSRFEAWLERASEYLNPILVKEARQALKSRQFVVTFTLLLVFGWGWSLAGVAMLSQAAYYAPGGRFMLTGYFIILAIPMIVIVPFSAFRSLAAEREDGTFELLAITTLHARQIVSGKLGSALVQMLVYYSALAPCIAFTYLLRGIDVLTIGMILSYTFLASLLLSQFGLLVATVSRSAHWQILLSVLLVIALVFCDIVFSTIIIEMVFATGAWEFDNVYFWIAHFGVLTAYASFLALFLYAAAAQISFASENRSTKLRAILVMQQLLWIGWMTYIGVEAETSEVLYVVAPIGGVYWFFMGSLLCGEGMQLSPRVKRSLPQSFLGRMLFTWFNPGSGTGFVFAVANMWALVLFVCAGAIVGEAAGRGGANQFWEIIASAVYCGAYLTAYLGVGRFLILLLRKSVATGLLLPLLLNIVFALLGTFVPLMFAGWLSGFSTIEYSALQITNWAWSVSEAVDGNAGDEPFVLILLFGFAAVMLFVNLLITMREVEHIRLATPQRVLDDEWQLHPEKAPQPPRRKGPWDDEPIQPRATP